MTKKEQILQLYAEGKSYRQIQKILGVSKGTISYHVGSGQKEKTSNRRKQSRHRNRAYIRKAKQGKKCTDCKEDYPHWVLEFDHLPQYEKKFTLGGNSSRNKPLAEIQAEIEKCEIVCANCHRNRTYWRQLKNGEYNESINYYEEDNNGS